jgi:GT2 family glycosyltransferase
MSRGDIVVRTDDDVVADGQWLSEIVTTFSRSTDIGGVSGPTLIPLERLPQRDVFMFLPDARKNGLLPRIASSVYVSFFLEGEPYAVGRIFKSGAWSPGSNLPKVLELKEPVEVEYLEACNMAIRKNLIKEAGWLDFTYRSIAEWSEVDLSFRIRNLGYRLVFNPRAIVHHMVSRAGVYVQREFASDRMMNLIYFYFTHIGPDTVEKYLRFFSYLGMLQVYWFFKFISTGNRHYLSGIIGTARGLRFNLKNSIGQRA